MAEKRLDLGTTPERDQAMLEKLKEHPCFGGCGKTWEEAGGGWIGFAKVDGKVELAPAWHCSECSKKRSEGDPGLKADEGDQELALPRLSWGLKPRHVLLPFEENERWVDMENMTNQDREDLKRLLEATFDVEEFLYQERRKALNKG